MTEPTRPRRVAFALGANLGERETTLQAAVNELRRCAGTHFDPAVVATFTRMPLDTFADIRRKSFSERSPADAAAAAVHAALAASAPSLTPAARRW